MQRKITATLSPFIAKALGAWADKEGSKPATLANFLIESAVREALKDGLVNEPDDDDDDDLAAEFLKLLAAGEAPQNGKLLKLAHELDISEEMLISIRDVYLANRNKKAKC